MDIVAALVARLKSAVPVLQGHVAGSIELEDAIASTQFIAPYGFVIALGEVAHQNEMVNSISQRIDLTFSVVLAVQNGKAQGIGPSTPTASKLEAYRKEVLKAVLGWQYGPDYDPATFLRGRMVNLQSKVLWWQDEFQTSFYRRA